MSEDVHADIAAIQKIEAASDRLARSVNDRLPSIHQELRMVSEALDERRNELQHKISSLRDEISSADKDEDTSWARRSLEEAEESFASVERRRRRLSETSAVFTAQARKMESLATDHTVRAREFLRGTVDDLKAYFVATAGEIFSKTRDGGMTSVKTNAENASESPVEIQRAAIAAANYTCGERIKDGVNKKYFLYNGNKILFKPANGESPYMPDGFSGTQYIREVAASVIDEALGLDLVPVTGFISFTGKIHDDFYNCERGSAQLCKSGYRDAKDIRFNDGDIVTRKLTHRQRHNWHLLDYVLGQFDRHESNWMAKKQGSGYDIIMIDNGLCLSTNKHQNMYAQLAKYEYSSQTKRHPKPAEGEFLDDIDKTRLKRFVANSTILHKRLSDIGVEPEAVELMFDRAKELLRLEQFLPPSSHVD